MFYVETKLFFSLALLLFISSCTITKDKELAEKSTAKFHSQYNAGQFHEVYSDAAEDMKKTLTEDNFMRLMISIRKKLGILKEANQTGFQITSNLGHTYITVLYEANFEKDKAEEQFTWITNGNHASLIGYHINSPSFLIDSTETKSNSTNGLIDQDTGNNSAPGVNRESLALQEALLGHWINTDGTIHLYISKGEMITIIDNDKTYEAYVIDSMDEKAGKVNIKISSNYYKILTFSANRRNMSAQSWSSQDAVNSNSYPEPINWIFVDNKQRP